MGQQVSELRKVMWKETYDIRGFVVDALYAVEKLAEAEFRVFYEKVRSGLQTANPLAPQDKYRSYSHAFPYGPDLSQKIKEHLLALELPYMGPKTLEGIAHVMARGLYKDTSDAFDVQGPSVQTRETWALTADPRGILWRFDILLFTYTFSYDWEDRFSLNIPMHIYGVAVVVSPAITNGLSRNDLIEALQQTYGADEDEYRERLSQQKLDEILGELDGARKAQMDNSDDKFAQSLGCLSLGRR